MRGMGLGVLMVVASVMSCPAGEITLDPYIHGLGGNVRGFGVLAEYPAGGPRGLTLVRATRAGADLAPDQGGWGEICSLRIFDPAGKLVRFVDLGVQREAEKTYRIELPEGPAGVWRFSVANGLNNDRYRLSFPETPTWGVRGEMALGVGGLLPKRLYLYVPETAKLLIVETFGANGPKLSVGHGDAEWLRPEAGGGRCRKWRENPPAGDVLSVDVSGLAGSALVIDGMPGLLCPTPEAAKRLQGGLVRVGGLYAAGPLQAAARRLMQGISAKDCELDLPEPKDLPATLEHPQLECLLFGKYGPQGSVASASACQVLDPASPFHGANLDPTKDKPKSNPQEFLFPGVLSPFDANALAALASLPLQLNTCRNKTAIVNRAVLASFYHFANLQGDDLIRENDFRGSNYPMTHGFFVYDALAKAFASMRDQLPPEIRELYQAQLINVGDKLAAFTAYQSNQWSHVITGHLAVYRATGEERFKRYFETLMTAYLDNRFGPESKFGQHPAGYFLEQHGPDGNYDHLNMFSVVAAYHHYRSLPGADAALVAKLKQGIEKNLYFKSFHWLRQPDGELFMPNALNCRTNSLLCYPSYPGDYMAGREFDLALSRTLMNKMPAKGSYPASVFPHLANTDEWAWRLIREAWPKGIRANEGATSFSGAWTPEIYDAYRLPVTAKPAPLPCEREGVWELPGQIAWKQGPLYGVVFYDVPAPKRNWELPGITSGGPLVLWEEHLGSALASMRSKQANRAENPEQVTWSGVYGKAGDKFWASGKETNRLEWIEKGKSFVLAGKLRGTEGELRWQYTLAGDKLEIEATLAAPQLKDAVLSLPFRPADDQVMLPALKNNRFHYLRGDYFLRVSYPAGVEASISDSLETSHKTVKALRLPFPADGKIKLVVDAGKY